MLEPNESAAPACNVPEHEREEYSVHRQKLMQEIGPLSPLECDLFEQLLAASWNLWRYRRFENELYQNGANPFLDEKLGKALDRLNRFKVIAEASYHRSFKAIKEIQTNYTLRATLPEPLAEAVTGLTDSQKIYKYVVKSHKPARNSESHSSSYVYRDREIFNRNDYPPPYETSGPETYAEPSPEPPDFT